MLESGIRASDDVRTRKAAYRKYHLIFVAIQGWWAIIQFRQPHINSVRSGKVGIIRTIIITAVVGGGGMYGVREIRSNVIQVEWCSCTLMARARIA